MQKEADEPEFLKKYVKKQSISNKSEEKLLKP